jgi:hypothetical protein
MGPLRYCRRLLLICCACLHALAAHADVTSGDMQIMGRALTFLDQPMSGEATVGIGANSSLPVG